MHTYTVSLRVESPVLDAAKVTRELAISPTQTRAKGQWRSETSVWNKALWEFEVFPESRSHWDALEAGLAALLRTLQPITKMLQEYRKSHDVYIWCGHFSSSFDGGPQFSAEILRKLGDFGIPLWIDTYSASGK